MVDPDEDDGYVQLPDEHTEGHHPGGSTSSHSNAIRPHRGSSLRTVDSQVLIDTDPSSAPLATPSQPTTNNNNPDLTKPTGNLKIDSAPSAAPQQSPHEPWYKNWSSILSLELKNTGSVARDHLASERTFLAWMRTSISLAMAGVGKSFG